MEEYRGKSPGCFRCKEPISPEDDYYVLTWKGKTWAVEVNYHLKCLIEAVQEGEVGGSEDLHDFPFAHSP